MVKVVCFLLCCFASASCQGNEDDGFRNIVKANNRFATNLFRVLPRKENVFISPLTISTVLSMVNLGARGNTSKEMSQVLQHDTVGLFGDDVHKEFHKLQEYLKNDVKYTLDFLNSVFLERNFEVAEEYVTNLTRYYNTELHQVNFAFEGDAIRERINGWVAEATKGKITEFLKTNLDINTRLFLMSAVYFQGIWETKFNEKLTEESEFFNDGEFPVNVTTMNWFNARLLYTSDKVAGFSAIDLPYQYKQSSMIVLLPKDYKGLEELEQAFNAEFLETLFDKRNFETLHVSLPKFKINSDYSLPSYLKTLGIVDLFQDADLSGVSETKGLHVTDVLHKSAVEVNEKGAEAASVSGVSIGERIGAAKPPILFKVDHPFMFVIRDIKTGLILFLGRVNRL